MIKVSILTTLVMGEGPEQKCLALKPHHEAILKACIRHNMKLSTICFLRGEYGLTLREAMDVYTELAYAWGLQFRGDADKVGGPPQ